MNSFKIILGYLSGDIINKAIPFLLLPIIANQISIEQFGIYSTEVIIYNFLISLIGMGLQAKIIIDTVNDDKNRVYSTYVSSAISFLFSILTLIIYILITCIYSSFFEKNIFFIIGIATIQVILINLVSSYQAINRVLTCSFINISSTLIYFSGILYTLKYSSWDNLWLNIFILYIPYVTWIYIFFIAKNHSDLNKTTPIIKKFKENIIFGIFQLPHVLSSWVRIGYDRILIAGILTFTDVGGYSSILQLGLITSVVVQSLNKFWTPFILKKLKEKSIKIKKYYSYFLISTLLISLFNLIFGYIFILFFMPQSYSNYLYLLPYVCISYFFQGCYFTYINKIYYLGHNRLISLPSIISVLFHILIAPILINYFDLLGAAWSMLISWIILFVTSLILISYLTKKKNEKNIYY